MLKDKLMDFYLRKCQIKMNGKFRTAAYKPGVAENASKRDTKSDFNKTLNAAPKINSSSLFQDGSAIESQIIHDSVVRAPHFFIEELEKFVLNEYFEGDERFFDTKHEFIVSYEETTKKYEELIRILANKDVRINKLKSAYDELDLKQSVTLDLIKDEYNAILSDIQKELRKFCDPIGKAIVKINNPPTPVVAAIATTNSLSKEKLVDKLTTDFIIYLSNDRAYLQHKEYHKDLQSGKMKDPTENKGSFSCDIKNNTNPKFQFHNLLELTSKYDAACIGLKKALNIFTKAGVAPIQL